MTVESDALPDALDPLGVLVMTLGPDGTVVRCNESVVDTLGLPMASILGRHHQGLFGALDVSRASVVDRSIFRADGQSRRIRWSLSPEFDDSGMPSGLSCLGIEVPVATSSVAVTEALMRRSNEGVFLIDGNGRIEKINRAAAQMFGVEEEAIVGELMTGLMPDRFRELHAGQLTSYPESHPDAPARGVVGLRSNGLEFPLTLHVEEVNTEDSRRFVGFARDESHRAAIDKSDNKNSKHLRALRDVLKASEATSPIELTRGALPRIAEQMAAQAAAVAFQVDGEQFIEFFGVPPETAPMVLDLLGSGEFNPPLLRALTRLHLMSCTPLVGSSGAIGHVLLFSRHECVLDPEQIDTLESLTRSLAVSLQNIVITQEIETVKASRDSAHEAILRAMVAALELRDHETEGHTQRVTRISLQLGEALGLRDTELRNLEHGALLHDVGKIGIPDAILHKPGPLSAAEWEVMRKHPQYAYDILSPLPLLSHALDVPFCHHERYDGTGYPRGLQGSEIPLSARIFAVVDVFDAMTTERPYRPALPAEYAMAHLQKQSGSHFDPVVVEAFTALVNKWPVIVDSLAAE